MKIILRALPAIAVLGVAAGCATPGAPQAPSLELPRPVRDLQAVRKGDKVTLTWTMPQLNTDRTRIRHEGPTRVCRGLNAIAMDACLEVVASLLPLPSQFAGKRRAQVTDTLPLALQRQDPSGFVAYAVEVQNEHGRSAGLSNRVEIPLAPVAERAAEVRATVVAEGVRLDWSGSEPVIAADGSFSTSYHVYRQPATAPPDSARTELGAGQQHDADYALLDRSIEWEKPYRYLVTPVTQFRIHGQSGQFDGEDVAIEVVPHDIFPPAVPAGLQAVFSGLERQKFIDLTWNPDTDADLSGYNVYRHETGTQAVRINTEVIKTPAFRDSNVQSGRTYFYSVSALDVRRNESQRSAEAQETVP